MQETFNYTWYQFDYRNSQYLKNHETSGVYLIKFNNNMQYVGSSKDIYNRLITHFHNLKSKKKGWYRQAAQTIDINNWYDCFKVLNILFCPCRNYKEYESYLLQSIKDKDSWYNTKFK